MDIVVKVEQVDAEFVDAQLHEDGQIYIEGISVKQEPVEIDIEWEAEDSAVDNVKNEDSAPPPDGLMKECRGLEERIKIEGYTDIEFRRKVMEEAMSATVGDTLPAGFLCHPAPAVLTATTSSLALNRVTAEDVGSLYRWTHSAILLLIETYRSYEGDFSSGKISGKRAWDSISRILITHGHEVTGPQCQSKYSGLKKTFKSVSDHNKKSGNNMKEWPYFQVMQDLLGDRPFMEPVALASSSREYNKENVERSARPKKRKGDEITPAQKRHEERMQRADSLLEKIDILIQKL